MLERKNINIPISGGENQSEDSYLLKPPYLKVQNGYYLKDGSIKKRGAYQFLQSGFSPSATPFVFGDSLHVLDNDEIYKIRTPSGSPSTVPLDTLTEALPVTVYDVPLSQDGAVEIVSASDGAGRVMVAWTQPVPPSPDSTILDKVMHLYLAEYNDADLTTPSAGPFRIMWPSGPVDIEELALTFGGGRWVLSGILRKDGTLVAALIATANVAQTFTTVRATCNHYDVYTDPITGSTWWLVQELNNTSNPTASLRTWGSTVGVRGDINFGSFVYNSVTLGTVAGSPNFVGDKMLAIHVKGSTVWCAVASTRHKSIYVYTTNLSWGSPSAATVVYSFSIDEPEWTGNWFDFADTVGSIDEAYPYYVPDNVLTSYISTNDRLGRLAVCTNETQTGVYVLWTAPVLSDYGTTSEHFLPGLDITGTGDAITVTSSFGVCWRNVTDALSVGSALGVAPCSYLHGKPQMSGGKVYVPLSMSLENQLDLPRSFNNGTPIDPPSLYPGEAPQWSLNDANHPNMAVRESAWKMGQLCILDGTAAIPVAQWGADLLAGPAWGLFDRSHVGTKGADETPIMSTRRPVEMCTVTGGWVIPGLYLTRSDHVIYERVGDSSGFHEEIEGRRMKAVLAHVRQSNAPRNSAVVVGEEVYFSNGWMGVYDGFYLREAAPNFIPGPPVPIPVEDDVQNNSFFQKDANVQVSWLVVDHKNRLIRGSLSQARTLSRTDGDTPPIRELNFKVYDQPPSLSRAGARTRFEVWFDGWRTDETTISRHNLYDPSRFVSSGPFRFTVVDPRRGWGDVLPPGGSELLSEPVGGCVYLTSTSNRIWYIEPEDIARVRFSKDFSVLGRVEFNRNLYVDIPDGSRPVAVASLDEQVVIFTDRSIYLVVGNLPNNSGGGGNFYLQRVAFEEGCSNRYSVLETRLGIFFESKRGINLLTRGYEVVFAGSAVEDSAIGGSSVTGACHLPKNDLYLFTTATKTLVAQEVGGQIRWTEWLLEHDGNIVASCAWGDYHVILNAEGNLLYMDFDVVTDVVLAFTTPWLYFGELEGFQRIRDIHLVGRNDTVSPLGSCAIQIGYDFAESFSETSFYEYGPALGSSPMRIRYKPRRQKSACFRLRFAEIGESVTTGEPPQQTTVVTLEAAVTIAGISVEVALKNRGRKGARNTKTVPS